MASPYRTFSRTAFSIALLNISGILLTGFSMPKATSQLRRWAADLLEGGTYEATLVIPDGRALRGTGLALRADDATVDLYLDVSAGEAAVHGGNRTRWVLDERGFELRRRDRTYAARSEDLVMARALLAGLGRGLWGCVGHRERGAPYYPGYEEIVERVQCPPGIIPEDREVQLLFRSRANWRELEGIALRDPGGPWHTAWVVRQSHGAPWPSEIERMRSRTY